MKLKPEQHQRIKALALHASGQPVSDLDACLDAIATALQTATQVCCARASSLQATSAALASIAPWYRCL